jgi:excisionase family DNA binding protein
MTEERLMTPPQVARRLQVNERTVTQWLRNGHLRGFKIGKEWRVSPRDLEVFLEQSANVPAGAGRR